MSLDLEAAERLLEAGNFNDIVDAIGAPAILGRQTSAVSAVAAQAQFYAGHLETSRKVALSENTESAPSGVRARCELVLGLHERRQAHPEVAVRHFQNALRLANDAKDFKLAAWSAVHLFRLTAEMGLTDALSSTLAHVRKHVVRAGSPHAAAFMHDSISMMEASGGRLDEARRHSQLCRELIERNPNPWLTQLRLANAFYIDFLDCRFEDALGHLQTARSLGRGDDHHRPLLDCNEGHAFLALGKFEAAERLFTRIVVNELPIFELAALEGLARLYLITDRMEACESTLSRFRAAVHRAGADQLFEARWFAVTKLKLLLKQQKWKQAAEEARAYLTRVGDTEHGLFVDTIRCLLAEALAGSGSVRAANDLLIRAMATPVGWLPEQQAAYCRTAGVLLSNSGCSLSRVMFDRLDAISRTYGNESIRAENQLALGCHILPSTDGTDAALQTANGLASALTMAHSPRLLGRELAEVLRALDCSSNVTVLEYATPPESPSQRGRVFLPLGQEQGRSWTLACDVPADSLKAIALNDVLRVGRAATSLEGYRRAERSRAALWPADPVELEGGSIFVSEEMQALLATARRIATTDVPVLITGETGTGKEVLARTIHALSARAKGTFLPFNCTSTPRDMLDSQLFGHRRGAFTGASEHFQGVIRAAAGGTLFLDEIGDMSLEVQPKMLRFLESGEVHPIGEAHPRPVDVRVIAATNVPLDTLITTGQFRDDLFYRLNIVRLNVPLLRDRRVEIPALASYYLQKHAQEYRKGDLRLSEETMEYLVLYRWPGNVRQLANEMRRLAALAESGAVLMPEHLSTDIAASRRTVPPSQRPLDPTEVIVRLDQPLPAAIEHLERSMLLYALKKAGGRMEETAALLGVSRKGLYLKRQRFNIEPPRESHTEVA